MKKIILNLLLLLLCSTAIGQQSSQHLQFKGIPINGTHKTFSDRLIAKGFTHNENISNLYNEPAYLGKFSGYENARVFIHTTAVSNTVYTIIIQLPASENWNDLYSTYSQFKKNLTQKYNQPTKCVERFLTADTNSNEAKYQQVSQENCEYYSIFETDKGSIALYIDYSSFLFLGLRHVSLQYLDKANDKLNEKEKIDDL